MGADWSALSAPQIRCIAALDFAVPLHHSHLTRRYDVRGSTIVSLELRGLVRRASLFEEGSTIPMPFYTLTQAGLAYKRDWRRWNAAVARKIDELLA